jgi:hypothetical protein
MGTGSSKGTLHIVLSIAFHRAMHRSQYFLPSPSFAPPPHAFPQLIPLGKKGVKKTSGAKPLGKPNFGKDPNLKKEDFIIKGLNAQTVWREPG